MTAHCTFSIEADSEPTLLARVLLAFNRRRLAIQALQFLDVDPGRPAELQIDLDCSAAVATDVAKQIRRIVGVREVTVGMAEYAAEPVPLGPRVAA